MDLKKLAASMEEPRRGSPPERDTREALGPSEMGVCRVHNIDDDAQSIRVMKREKSRNGNEVVGGKGEKAR